MMNARRYISVVLVLLFFTAADSLAQTMSDGILINADDMDHDTGKGVARLKGNVQIVFKGQHLSSKSAQVDFKKQQIVAEGNVLLYNERVHVEGERIVFNYKANTGYIYKGFVQSGQVVFQGDVIQKMDENRYIASNAHFTACDTCPPGWSFSGQKIDAELGGYARIRRPVFRIGGFPILPLPSIIVPLKSARQSGLLVPSFEVSGRGGSAVGLPYFWALDRSQDLTFTPTYYEHLGTKLHGDYRYVLSDRSKGRLRSAWIRDEVFPNEYALTKDLDRWFAWYEHHMDLPDGYVHRMQIKGVSDIRYPRDFPEEIEGHGDPALENKMSISQSSDDRFISAEVDIYTNLMKTYPLAGNEDAVHRMPELRYNVKEQSLGESGLFFGLDLNYVSFAREGFHYDDMLASGDGRVPLGVDKQGNIRRDGKFDAATDLYRTGQRLDIRPRLSYPFQIAKKFDVLPALSFRETQYRFFPTESAIESGFNDTAARRYVQTDLLMKTEFYRVYGGDSEKAERLKHSIEPEIGYSHIPWRRTPDHPFFGTNEGLQYSRQFEPISNTDLGNPNTGVQFDYDDRTFEREVVDFGITNRLTRKYWLNGEPDYRTVGLFRISQSYDFNESRADNPHPWSSINALLDARFDKFETYTTASYNGYAKVMNTSSRVRFMPTLENFLELSYTRGFILTDEYEVAENGETRNFGFGAGLMTKYFEAQGRFAYEARTWKLQSFEYGIGLKPPGRCWLISVFHRQAVAGDPKFGVNINFQFGGEESGQLF